MEARYAEVLIDSFQMVFQSFSTCRIQSTRILDARGLAAKGDISASISLLGDLDGRVCMSMEAKTGQKLASEMLGGVEIPGINEYVISAVGELCNMVMGNACAVISSGNGHVDITPPVINIFDSRLSVNTKDACSITINIEEYGFIDFVLAMEQAC